MNKSSWLSRISPGAKVTFTRQNPKVPLPLSKTLKLLLICGSVGAGLAYLYLRFWPTPPETPCEDIPENTVAVVPGFKHLGKDPATGCYRPGAANERIAEKVQACAERFCLVLTQKSVSDALLNPTRLRDGTPVAQMHEDNEHGAGTLEAIRCAIGRLVNLPPETPIGIIAHDRHWARAHHALVAALRAEGYANEIMDIHLGPTPYRDDNPLHPWQWAARELWARPLQALLALRPQGWGFRCSEDVAILEKL